MSIFTVERQVEYADTDMAGIVHFTAFFRYMEAAEHALFRSFGLSIHQKVDGRQLGWPRVKCTFEFMAPLRFEDEIEIRLSLLKMGQRSVTYQAEVVRDGTLVARGQSTSVCCEMMDGKSVEATDIPAAVREKLAAYLAAAAE